jgi:myo-inositol catabolism protein IolC
MTGTSAWQPRHDDPLFILAMDHRTSFGETLFGVKDDNPDAAQLAAMKSAKELIFDGLRAAIPMLTSGRAGVLVDEQYGEAVIETAMQSEGPVVLAVPVEASGHDWFTLQWGNQWVEHVERVRPDYAKVLVRDNPDFGAAERERQLADLAKVSAELRRIGVPLIYELLVPATQDQLSQAGQDALAYDRDIRPGLVAAVIADNQAHAVEPELWKVEGLETVEAARLVARQVTAGPVRGPYRPWPGRARRAAGPLAHRGCPGTRVRRLRDRAQHLGRRGALVRAVRSGHGRPGEGSQRDRRAVPWLRRPVAAVMRRSRP